MKKLWVVLRKEIVDNARDRRTLLSALLLGPLGPALFLVVLGVSLGQAVSGAESALRLAVSGRERAPSLIGFLEAHGVSPKAGPGGREAAKAAVSEGAEPLVLVVPQGYAERFRRGVPARVELVLDRGDGASRGDARRVRRLVRAWSEQIGALRLRARGLDPNLVEAVRLEDVDVATPQARSALILGTMSYFLLFAMLAGGMHLAIDTTAGERERGSLEPLLALPVPRRTLILGKILATTSYMVLSLAIALASFVVLLPLVPFEEAGVSARFGPATAGIAFLLVLPFSLLGAAGMTVVASFTKSFKEAQSYMTVVLLLPTVPIMIAALLSVRPALPLMLVPSLSQHLLVIELIKGEPLDPLYALASVGGTLLLGGLAAALAARLYRREALLG